MPDIRSLFGKDIIERTKYSVLVCAVALLMLAPHLFSKPLSRAFAITVPLVIVISCGTVVAEELEQMAFRDGWSRKVVNAIVQGCIVFVGLVIALALAVIEWRLYLVLLFGTFATDSFALLGGRVAKYIARWHEGYEAHPMTKFSENKTIEGLVTGVVFGWLFTYLTLYACAWLTGFVVTVPVLVVVGFLPIVAVLGDYYESIVKRTHCVKESGTLLGPHGGMLDRIDSICAVYATVGFALLFI